MRFGRPRPCTRLAAVAVPALVALLVNPVAFADTFKRDETPLPATITNGGTTTPAQASSGGGAFVRLVIGLVIVLVLVFAVSKLLKRSQRGSSPRTHGDMTVVATTALAPNRAVHLLRVGEELVLVGSAEQGVTQLRVYDAAEARTLLDTIDQPSPRPIGPRTWSQALEDLKRRTAR